MAREPSPVKPQQWTERLQRFEESQQTVAEFCKAEGVSEGSFYQWKRRLKLRTLKFGSKLFTTGGWFRELLERLEQQQAGKLNQ